VSEQKQVSGVHGAATVGDGFPVRTLSPSGTVQTQAYSVDQALILHELERALAAVNDAEIAVAQE
jgi:hypothetical protein